MKVVIMGGTGLIGRKLATKLESGGHHVVAAAPSTRVNSLTGEGLQEVLTGANVVVDVTNSPVVRGQCRPGFLSELDGGTW